MRFHKGPAGKTASSFGQYQNEVRIIPKFLANAYSPKGSTTCSLFTKTADFLAFAKAGFKPKPD
jgi:hypothetical protein